MKITVRTEHVETRSGTSGKTGKPWTMHTQEVTAETDEFRGTMKLTLADDGKPVPLGEYDVDWDKSVRIGQFGDPVFKRQLVLVSRRAAKAA